MSSELDLGTLTAHRCKLTVLELGLALNAAMVGLRVEPQMPEVALKLLVRASCSAVF